MPNILLLRTPDSVVPDRYEDAFRRKGPDYNPTTIAVLETVFANLDKLSSILNDGPDSEGRGYDGVVITSKRSCEAIGECIGLEGSKKEQQEKSEVGSGGMVQGPPFNHNLHKWSSVPFYVVGEGTATALRDAFNTPPSPSPIDVEATTDNQRTPLNSAFPLPSRKAVSLDIRGQSSGNANNLGPFIISDLAKSQPRTSNQKFRLLYLTGDKNKDTLPSILTGPEADRVGGIELDEVQVYQTQGSTSFERDLVEALTRAEIDMTCPPLSSTGRGSSHARSEWWIVHFAPSAASFVHPIIQRHFAIRLASAEDEGPPSSLALPLARIAAIGPTTYHALRGQLGVHVDVVSPKPSAEVLVKAIVEFGR